MPPDQQRYLLYVFYNNGYANDPNFNWTPIETAIKNGCNGIELCVPWSEIYPTRNGPANWATLDRQIDRITQLGAKVALRIGLHRDLDRVDAYWTEENGVHNYHNELLYRAHARQFSLAHQPTLNLAVDFVAQVAQRYSSRQQQGDILFMAVTNTPILEQEYMYENEILYQANLTSTITDYSTAMVTGFRTWLTTKYTTITAVNTAWNSNYSAFSDIQPPGFLEPTVYTAFVGVRGKDWYAYRHKVHKNFIDQTTSAIKTANSSYKVVSGYGSIFDEPSVYRGTLGFKNYAQNTDGVKVDNGPFYPHRFTMDLVRSNVAPGKWVMNEMDGQNPTSYGLGVYMDWATQSFQHGAKAITLANFTGDVGLEYVRQICQQLWAQGWKDSPIPDFKPVGTIPVKLSRLVESGYSQLGIQSQWNQIYNQNGNQPVNIPIDEDILDTTTPTSTTTTPPVAVTTTPPGSTTTTPPVAVTTTPPGSATTTPPVAVTTAPVPTTTAVGAFTLVTPSVDCTTGLMTFKTAGGDGTPIDYLIIGYTDWSPVTTVTLSAEQRSGMTFTVAARQSGHEVKFTFVTNCSGTAPAPVNQPPVLVTPLSNQTAVVAQSFSYVIPATTFKDTDGQLVSWAVSGLPAGLTYTAATQTISGTPLNIGTASVTVLVTDNGGATAQTTFTIKTFASNSTPPTTPSALSVIAPVFDCATGKLIFRSAGGDGSPIEYFATGIKSWSTDSAGYIALWQRDGVTFSLQARQSGKQASLSFKTSCLTNKAPVVVTPIASQTASLARSYSYVIPAATFSDPDGQLVSWAASNLPVGLTFDAATHTISGTPSLIGPNVVTITVTDNGGASVQTTFILQVLGNNAPATPLALSVVAPGFDCTTGKLIFRSTGGDGSPVEYFAVGIKVWSRDSVGFVVPWQRDGVTFTLQARQSGRQASLSFKTSCSTNKPPVVVTPIASQTASLARSYSYVIPAATFSDPDGQLVSWAASNLPVGLTFDAATHTISGIPAAAGMFSVTMTVTDNGGASVQTSFVIQVVNPTATIPKTAPPSPAALTLLAPAFDCGTGKLIFRPSGGDGTTVEFMAVGIKDWSSDSVAYIDPWLRSAGTVFTLQARQSGKLAVYSFTVTCGIMPPSGGRVAAPEVETVGWQAWPNPVERELTVAVPPTVTTTTLRVMLHTMSGLAQDGAVESTRVEHGQLHLTLSPLSTGMYFLRIYDGDRPLHTLKVLHK